MMQYVLWPVILCLLGLVIWQHSLLRRSLRATDSALSTAKESIGNTALAEDIIETLTRRLTESVEWGDRQARRAEEYFGVFRVIENERDLWQKLYTQSSTQAGAAQAWLLRELERVTKEANNLAHQLRQVKPGVRDVQIDPNLTVALEEFGTTHPGGAQVERAPAAPTERVIDPRPTS